MSDSEIDTGRLAELLRQQRGAKSLRDVERELDGSVSASTLSRIEQGRVPDLDTFIRLCRWLEVPPSALAPGLAAMESDTRDTAERIAFLLRADRTFTPEAKQAIMTMVRLAQQAATAGTLPNEWETLEDE